MDFSKLGRNEKMAVYASVVVVVTALISIANDWGMLMFIPLLAAIAALAVVLAPQVMPSTRMPGSNGSLLTVLGVASALVWVVVLIDNLGWVLDNIVNLDTFQFVIGLIAAVVLAWFGWQMLQAEGGRMRFGSEPQQPGSQPQQPGSQPQQPGSQPQQPGGEAGGNMGEDDQTNSMPPGP